MAGRQITTSNASDFWAANDDVARECGCYVYAIKASKGYKPIYVGKATRSFKSEVFSAHKLTKINLGLCGQKRGAPVLFFVPVERSQGRVNKTAIDDAESFLIQAGLNANKDLLNDKKTKTPTWRIHGLVRSSQGKRSSAAAELKRCIKL